MSARPQIRLAASESDRIAATGIELVLDKPHRVKFGMRALRYLEQKFGSVDQFIAALNQKGWGEDRVRSIVQGMTAGLLHEQPKQLSELELEQFELYVEGLLDDDVGAFVQWINTMALAINEGWPEPSSRTAPKAQGSRRSSHGASSITSRRSSSGAATRAGI